jgi:hypothetical protein
MIFVFIFLFFFLVLAFRDSSSVRTHFWPFTPFLRKILPGVAKNLEIGSFRWRIRLRRSSDVTGYADIMRLGSARPIEWRAVPREIFNRR